MTDENSVSIELRRMTMARRILAAELNDEHAAAKLLNGGDRMVPTKAAIRAMLAYSALPSSRDQPEELARRFHEAYERLAPSFGYETRPETREFDSASSNGRLMISVCASLLEGQPS